MESDRAGTAPVASGQASWMIRRFGQPGRRFLAALPDRVTRAVARWSLDLGDVLPGGIGGVLFDATTESGEYVVLKLVPVGGAAEDLAAEREAHALQAWDGAGAARLLAADLDDGALLLERCMPGATLDHLAPGELLRTGLQLALRLHRPPSEEDRALLPDAVAQALAAGSTDAPHAAGVRDRLSPHVLAALASARARVTATTAAVMVCHGDLNPGNVLAAQREPWLAIDPIATIAPRPYDAASLVWSGRDHWLHSPGALAELGGRIALAADVLESTTEDVHAWTLLRTEALLFDRAGWGGYDEPAFLRLAELLAEVGSPA